MQLHVRQSLACIRGFSLSLSLVRTRVLFFSSILFLYHSFDMVSYAAFDKRRRGEAQQKHHHILVAFSEEREREKRETTGEGRRKRKATTTMKRRRHPSRKKPFFPIRSRVLLTHVSRRQIQRYNSTARV